MDVEWCLACNSRLNSTAVAYCSQACMESDNASENHYNHPLCALPPSHSRSALFDEFEEVELSSRAHWIGRGTAGIADWAANVPSGSTPTLPSRSSSSYRISGSSTPPTSRPSSSSAVRKQTRLPKLISHQRPLPPTLCMSTPITTTHLNPAVPITPRIPHHQPAPPPQPIGDWESAASFSTDSLIATPPSAKAYLPSLAETSYPSSWIHPSAIERAKAVAKPYYSPALHIFPSSRSSLYDTSISDEDLDSAWDPAAPAPRESQRQQHRSHGVPHPIHVWKVARGRTSSRAAF